MIFFKKNYMTTQERIKKLKAKLSTKYPDRYDVDGNVELDGFFAKKITDIPIPFGVVTKYFTCSHNQLTSLYNAPIQVGNFSCQYNKLITLDHLPKYIGGNLYCDNNPFQNLNALKNVEIKGFIRFSHEKEEQLDYYIKALYNTDLDTLEYHYDNHKYVFFAKELERYVMNVLEDIIKIKTMKNHLNL